MPRRCCGLGYRRIGTRGRSHNSWNYVGGLAAAATFALWWLMWACTWPLHRWWSWPHQQQQPLARPILAVPSPTRRLNGETRAKETMCDRNLTRRSKVDFEQDGLSQNGQGWPKSVWPKSVSAIQQGVRSAAGCSFRRVVFIQRGGVLFL